MLFLEQHPKFKEYTHEIYSMDQANSIYFRRDLNGFIHSQLMKLDPEEIAHDTWVLQLRLAAIAESSPCDNGPYNYLLDEIARLFRKIMSKGFPYLMDSFASMFEFFPDEEINRFIKEQKIGYIGVYNNGEVDWLLQEGTIDGLNNNDDSKLSELNYIKNIGEGFFAHVDKYECESSGEQYALKRLKEKFHENIVYKNRFRREIDILKRLEGHEHIVPIVDHKFNESKNQYYYLMPCANVHLKEYIEKNNNKLDLTDRLKIFEQILSAMVFAHSLGVLHRDLSPNNVLIFDDKVVVSDFGLGKDYENLTKQGYSSVQGYGNINYVAPEQQDKLSAATKRSDVYSLGKLLYFILTGKNPRNSRDSAMYTTLISTATLDSPEERFIDAAAFQIEYNKYKALYNTLTRSIDSTVAEFLQTNKTASWKEFHEIVMKAQVNNHVFYDFIDPIVTRLNTIDTIQAYIIDVKHEVVDFIKLFARKLRECYDMTRWPFEATNSFGSFLNRMYTASSDYPQCQKVCLEEMWYIAAAIDQWSVQDLIISIINNNRIPSNIELDFALNMLESKKGFGKLENINLTQITSNSIKNAIAQLK
ncbi:serine/threonine-protein kinase [Bacillus thuringiensis]|uniref:serine/threonine-protein kinase n=1 Tax=Bacillus thuringiensis TaxID=1428 RepID=UPI00211D9814|nr:serine/threonine-protein kinase [Bacillus thuringiensis]